MSGFAVADRAELARADRVLLLRSKLPDHQALMRWIRADFEEVSVQRFGYGRFVHVFRRRGS